jgi:hypothetical protein
MKKLPPEGGRMNGDGKTSVDVRMNLGEKKKGAGSRKAGVVWRSAVTMKRRSWRRSTAGRKLSP